jgi:hypothetical protein
MQIPRLMLIASPRNDKSLGYAKTRGGRVVSGTTRSVARAGQAPPLRQQCASWTQSFILPGKQAVPYKQQGSREAKRRRAALRPRSGRAALHKSEQQVPRGPSPKALGARSEWQSFGHAKTQSEPIKPNGPYKSRSLTPFAGAANGFGMTQSFSERSARADGRESESRPARKPRLCEAFPKLAIDRHFSGSGTPIHTRSEGQSKNISRRSVAMQ